jgi:hypothetical protein
VRYSRLQILPSADGYDFATRPARPVTDRFLRSRVRWTDPRPARSGTRRSDLSGLAAPALLLAQASHYRQRGCCYARIARILRGRGFGHQFRRMEALGSARSAAASRWASGLPLWRRHNPRGRRSLTADCRSASGCASAERRPARCRSGRPARASPTTTSAFAFGLAMREWRSTSQLPVHVRLRRSRPAARWSVDRRSPDRPVLPRVVPCDQVVAASARSRSAMKAQTSSARRQRDSACSSAASTLRSRSCVWSPMRSSALGRRGERSRGMRPWRSPAPSAAPPNPVAPCCGPRRAGPVCANVTRAPAKGRDA